MSEAPNGPSRPPRWDPDERGIGVADARAHLARLDALRAAATEDGWVAEEPKGHLLPHIRRHVDDGTTWAIDATATEPDGTFVVDLRWTGSDDRRTIRVEAFALIGTIAEGMTAIAEVRESGALSFEVVTGMLAGESAFAPHGHTLRLRIDAPSGTRSVPDIGA